MTPESEARAEMQQAGFHGAGISLGGVLSQGVFLKGDRSQI